MMTSEAFIKSRDLLLALFCPFSLNSRLKLSSAVCVHCYLTILFMKFHILLLGNRSGVQAGQSTTHHMCLRSQAVEAHAE